MRRPAAGRCPGGPDSQPDPGPAGVRVHTGAGSIPECAATGALPGAGGIPAPGVRYPGGSWEKRRGNTARALPEAIAFPAPGPGAPSGASRAFRLNGNKRQSASTTWPKRRYRRPWRCALIAESDSCPPHPSGGRLRFSARKSPPLRHDSGIALRSTHIRPLLPATPPGLPCTGRNQPRCGRNSACRHPVRTARLVAVWAAAGTTAFPQFRHSAALTHSIRSNSPAYPRGWYRDRHRAHRAVDGDARAQRFTNQRLPGWASTVQSRS